jgi:hypothetical protein
MKKNLLWMLAAILFCGLTTTVFTSCGDDEDDSQPSTPEQPEKPEDKKAESADVTLTLVIQKSTLNVFEYDFKYVDAKGNTKTYDIDAQTEGVAFDELEQGRYNTYTQATFPAYGEACYNDMKKPLVLRVTLKDQPTGKKYSYETVCHVKEDFKYQEAFIYSFPSVFVTETPKGGKRTVKSDFQFQVVDVTNWERFKAAADGKTSTLGYGEYTVNED